MSNSKHNDYHEYSYHLHNYRLWDSVKPNWPLAPCDIRIPPRLAWPQTWLPHVVAGCTRFARSWCSPPPLSTAWSELSFLILSLQWRSIPGYPSQPTHVKKQFRFIHHSLYRKKQYSDINPSQNKNIDSSNSFIQFQQTPIFLLNIP